MGPVGVLDDYQGVAEDCADWAVTGRPIQFFHDTITDHDALVERLRPFEVIVAMRERTPFSRRLFSDLPHLRLLVTTGMRNASIDLEAASDHGVTVCGTGSPGHATAELTFGLILALARDLVGQVESVRAGGWQVGLGRDLRGATLGVVGMGRLGTLVTGYALAFGMEVVAWSENLTSEAAEQHGARLVTKRELFARADVVTVHVRLSDRTVGLVGSEELGWMRPSAFLVNTSRGPVVDSDALLAAVREGAIAGAAVDVFDEEPLPADHPMRRQPRILTTPHVGYVTAETYDVFYREAVEDIVAFDDGHPVRVLTG